MEKDVTLLTAHLHAAVQQSSGDAELSALPLSVDLQELEQEDQYSEPRQSIEDAADGIPTIDFDDIDALTESESEAGAIPASAPIPASATMGPPSRRPIQPGEEDTSTLVHHHHYFDDSISQFETALGLWATNVGISRTEYTGLREILHLLPHRDTGALPGSLTTLKRRLNRQLPLLDMRTKDIPLIREKLPTDTATRKARGVDEVPHETLHFFDPECLFKAFMSSDISKSMHIGMAHWVDSPVELWESRCWASSLRTTSGQYAHFMPLGSAENTDRSGAPIFPSDFVHFKCEDDSCDCKTAADGGLSTLHVGRVLGVGRDYRSDAAVKGTIVLQIQQAFLTNQLPIGLELEPQVHPNELVLSWNETFYVAEHDIYGTKPVEVIMDYVFGEAADKELTRRQAHFIDPANPLLFCRRQLNGIYLDLEAITCTPLCHTHPVRGELELKEFGRQMFVQEWDGADVECLSVPLLTFLDGFGVYRNSYRSLMGKPLKTD